MNSDKKQLKLSLCYIDEKLGEAFRKYFDGIENVSIYCGDICKLEVDAIVSPANSFGFMDGGLDLALSLRFGWNIQESLQKEILARPLAELLVGEAIELSTNDEKVPWIISAPTMRVPMRLRQSVNAYLAMKAIIALAQQNEDINHVAVPGLGTGTGYLSPDVSVMQMRQAYRELVEGEMNFPEAFHQAQKQHLKLNPDEINIWDPS